jgi:hypothetical protein
MTYSQPLRRGDAKRPSIAFADLHQSEPKHSLRPLNVAPVLRRAARSLSAISVTTANLFYADAIETARPVFDMAFVQTDHRRILGTVRR